VSAKPPEPPNETKRKKGAVSRRGFLGGVSLGTTVIGTGVLNTTEAQAATATSGPGEVPITLRINGKPVKVSVEPRVTLVDALRNRLAITGAKRVCDRATCGACTVIMNGKTVYGCTVLAIDAQGKDIQTIEGIAPEGKIHAVSAAFVSQDGQQCGYCTPGFVMAAKGYLDRHPNPANIEEVEKGLGGNLCRCGTYVGVRKAVLEAAQNLKGGRTNA
jgi:xanthine dehydrogenase YagT iron-sulfur-binding subunit